ncbi:MAG: hypothetical protein AAGH15_01850 [Myxococcota bacterium]
MTSVVLLPDLDASRTLELGEAVTFPGNAAVFGSPFEPNAVFVLDGESPNLTRFEVGRDGTFVEGETLALAGTILTPPGILISTVFFFAGPEQAYFFDAFAGALLHWNPVTMTVTNTLEIPPEVEIPGPNLFPFVGSRPVRSGDRFFASIGFTNTAANRISQTSLIVVVDVANDRIEEVLSTDLCAYLIHPHVAANGDVLVGTDVFSTAFEVATEGDQGGPVCVVRISADDLSIRREFEPRVPTGDADAGTFIFVGDQSAFMRVLDPEALPDTPLTRIELNNGEFWRWGFLPSFDADALTLIPDEGLGSGIARALTVDGRRFAVDIDGELGTRLVELRPDGSLVPGPASNQSILNVFPLTL